MPGLVISSGSLARSLTRAHIASQSAIVLLHDHSLASFGSPLQYRALQFSQTMRVPTFKHLTLLIFAATEVPISNRCEVPLR